MSREVSDPKQLLDAMQAARDAALGASVHEVMTAHLAGMEIIPNEMVRRPTLVVPPHIYEEVRERLEDKNKEPSGD